jgi:ribosomal protein L7/L12
MRQSIQDTMTVLLNSLNTTDQQAVLQTLMNVFDVPSARAQHALAVVPNKIEMIKALRAYSGADLRTAKTQIDTYIDMQQAQAVEHICSRVRAVLRDVGYNE